MTNEKRILMITSPPPYKLGGLSIYIKKLSNFLIKRDYFVDILSGELLDKKIFIIKKNKLLRFILLKSIFFSKKKDVQLFNPIPFLLKNYKNYEIFHIHAYHYFPCFISLIFLKLIGKKVILTLHGEIQFLKESTFFSNPYFILYYLMGKIQLKFVDALISVSKIDLLDMNNIFHIKREAGNYYLPNGVSLEVENYNRIYKRQYVTFIGPLTRRKGFIKFMELCNLLFKEDFEFKALIIGEGQLDYLIDDFPDQKIIKHYDRIEHSKIYKYYLKTKIFFFDSVSEGMPTTILEAMKYKVPIVASNIPSIRFLIKDGFNGLLFESNNIKEALLKVKLLWENPELRINLTTNAYKTLQKRFNWNNIGNQILELYKKFEN